jgi:hypothetical protein
MRPHLGFTLVRTQASLKMTSMKYCSLGKRDHRHALVVLVAIGHVVACQLMGTNVRGARIIDQHVEDKASTGNSSMPQ